MSRQASCYTATLTVTSIPCPRPPSYANRYPRPFRRYAGIITDLAYDHELAKNWSDYMEEDLRAFDDGVRQMLSRHQELLPDRFATIHGLR